jgi:uroporphyrin-III C-methyltransferase/precorrin-2 dehydrogenase/sirohydrochlorin ferrochelatase
VVARRVREKIESILPARIGDLAAFIGRWRKPMQAHLPEMSDRRKFWERIVDGPIGELILSGREREAEQALRAIENPEVFASERGFVTLVGAGPGDPDLLTVKALRALQDADVIFYDDLVSPEVLDRARRDAARVSVGRRIGKPGIGQDATNKLMIEAAREGKRAVRLKGGDSFIFGRGGEEIAELRAAGVAYAVIPGVTAGIGAAAQFEVPLTYRKKATRITFLTAHKTHDAEAVDWSLLTDVAMTVVVYMGITAAPAIRDGMLAAGRSPKTPVGVFARVTRPDAKAVVGTLDQLPDLVTQVENGPAILIIGDVVERSLPWNRSDFDRLAASLMERVP